MITPAPRRGSVAWAGGPGAAAAARRARRGDQVHELDLARPQRINTIYQIPCEVSRNEMHEGRAVHSIQSYCTRDYLGSVSGRAGHRTKILVTDAVHVTPGQ